jgi:phosphate-selective porin
MEIGAAVTRGSLGEEMSPLRGVTALGVPFFTSPRAASGSRTRASVHGVYHAGAAALKAEYTANHDERGSEAGALDAAAWYVSASYVLTGESEADAHHPRRPLFGGGMGSIEIAARTEQLRFKESGDRRTAGRAHTLGVNWQPIRFFRIQLNAIRDEIPGRKMWTHVFRMHLTI